MYVHVLSFRISLSQDGFTALHAACLEGHDSIVSLLLQAGANMDKETEVRLVVSQDFKCS